MRLAQLYPLLVSLLALALGGYNPWAAALPATEFNPTPGTGPVKHAMSAGSGPAASPVALTRSTPAAAAPVGFAGLAPEDGPALKQYNAAAIDYLSEIGFGAEYGSSAPVLHRWANDVRIKIHGSPTNADINALSQVVDELNQLVSGITLSVTDGESEIEMYFAPESHFYTIEPQYIPVNLGFFRVWWNSQGTIYRARILITSEGITQQERAHLIREELTQSLGLFKDSWKYPESIFYQGWTATNEYAPVDRAAISLLYSPQLRPSMTLRKAQTLLLADYQLDTLD